MLELIDFACILEREKTEKCFDRLEDEKRKLGRKALEIYLKNNLKINNLWKKLLEITIKEITKKHLKKFKSMVFGQNLTAAG